MTVNEAIERAGISAFLEGILDSSGVIGFNVLNQAGKIVARFNRAGIELPLPLVPDADTSNPQFSLGPSGLVDGDIESSDLASDISMRHGSLKSSSS